MARSKKTGLEYFSVDVNAVKEIKMMKLIHLGSGLKTVGFYFFMLSYIYEKGYYIHFTEDLCFWVSIQMKLSVDEVKVLLNECLKFGLFDSILYQEEEILTSEEIQRYYMRIINSCKRKAQLEKYNLLNSSMITNKKAKESHKEPDLFGNLPNKSETIPNNTEYIGNNTDEMKNKSETLQKNSVKSTRNKKESKKKNNNIYISSTSTPPSIAHAREKNEVLNEREGDISGADSPNLAITGESSEVVETNSEGIETIHLENQLNGMFMNLSEEWKQDVCSLYSLPREKLEDYLKKFVLHCHSIGKAHTCDNDLKSHFVSWLKLEINTLTNKQKSNEQQSIHRQSRQSSISKDTIYDRRRAAPIPIATAEDYKNSSF